MAVLMNILAFLVTLFVLVSLHEYGHFITARLLGVKVRRFSIGFGRPIWRHVSSRSGVEYVIGYIPLGGYVKLLDEREGDVPESELPLAFNRQAAWRRFLIIIAGPVMNIFLAVIAYTLMFMVGLEVVKPVIGEVKSGSIAAEAGLKPDQRITRIDGVATPHWQKAVFQIIRRIGSDGTMRVTTRPVGEGDKALTHNLDLKTWQVNELEPNPLKALGIQPFRPHLPPVIHHVKPGSPAGQAGLKEGDRILALGGKPVENWYQLIKLVTDKPGKTVMLKLRRDNVIKTVEADIGKKRSLFAKTRGYLGIGHQKPKFPSNMMINMQYPLLGSIAESWDYTWSMITFNYVILAKLVTGQLSMGSLGGPISIFQASATAFSQGIAIYLNFLALISIMLAILNTIPIPGLDGGHLLIILIEKIIRRPVPVSVEFMIYRLGFIALILLLIHATINDLMRLF